MKRLVLTAGLALALVRAARPEEASSVFRPFVMDHRAADATSLDLSFLLDAPAGQGGPIRSVGGHLVRPDGRRFRIWGVDLTDFAKGSIRFPAKADAEFWAQTLARFGVNCVRLHNLDVPAPRGLLAADGDDTRRFDAEELDRMDYFVAALKRRGIYLDLNLNVGRSYKPGDGVPDAKLLGYAKAVTLFDPHIIALERDYASGLLTHVNPYTRSDYRHEPAVAMIEIVNENSLLGAWIRGRLRGTKTAGRPENWQDLPPHYAQELTEQYNAWLQATLPPDRWAHLRALAGVGAAAPVPRLAPAEFAAAPRERFDLEASFYADVETRFFSGMRDFLRQTIGTSALLVGGSDFSYGKSDYPALAARATLDIVDAHGPWELSPMVDEPLNSIPVRVSRSAIAGKPFTVSEHNHRFPSDYLCEGIPLLATYGSFQDWDGIFLYTFELKPPGYRPFLETRADLSFDPVKLANLAAGALVFLRGDVRPARETVARSYSTAQLWASLRLAPTAAGVYFTPGFSPAVALQHGSRIATLDGAPTSPRASSASSPLVSDTGELSWYYAPHGAATREDDQKFAVDDRPGAAPKHTGVVAIDAERTQALIGFLPARPTAVTHLAADLTTPFACLVLTSLDGKPIARSARMLLAATARVINSGFKWNEERTGPEAWGGSPTLIEPVAGTIRLRGLDRATAVTISALDGAGRPAGRPQPAEKGGEGWAIRLGSTATTWYEIAVERPAE